MKILITAIATAILTMGVPASAGEVEVAKVMRYMTTPCQYEDSVNCYWDARTMGNGTGRSFYAIPVGDAVCIRYWNRDYDRDHGHCF